MDLVTLDRDSGPLVCTECHLHKPSEAFYLVRGPSAVGDQRAQPCADCCRRRVQANYAGGAARVENAAGRRGA